jgi:hypothetical protein
MIVPLAYSAEAAARLRRSGANSPSLKLRGISSEALAKEEASGDTLRSGKVLHPDRSWGKKWRATRSSGLSRAKGGGAEGNRTLDLLNAIQALSQLSYGPTEGRTEYRVLSNELKVEKRAEKVKPRSTANTKQALELVAPFYSELITRYSVLTLLAPNQLLGVAASLLGDFDAAEHARHFVHPLSVQEPLDPGEGSPFLDIFLDDEVSVGQGGDLRQMSHADDLMVRCHLL